MLINNNSQWVKFILTIARELTVYSEKGIISNVTSLKAWLCYYVITLKQSKAVVQNNCHIALNMSKVNAVFLLSKYL